MAFESYIKEIQGNLVRGNATEHTHRPALEILLDSFQPSLVATNEPRRIKAGAPDYILTQGSIPLGYVEAKDVGENLSRTERSDQLAQGVPHGPVLYHLPVSDAHDIHEPNRKIQKLQQIGR